MYQDQFGGLITPEVKIKGDVFLLQGSWISGKCIVQNVKIPYNTSIISLSIHNDHAQVGRIGDYELVKDYRISRGVYVSGLIRKEEHYELNSRVWLGYDLKIYGLKHVCKKVYKNIQKKSP